MKMMIQVVISDNTNYNISDDTNGNTKDYTT